MKRSAHSAPTMKKTGSKVSFDESLTKTIEVEPASNAQNASWYSSNEISNFREGEDSSTASHAVRKDFVRSLLNVQKEHKDMGIKDPKGLRQMSRACSKDSIKKAIQRANEIVEEDDQ